MSSCIHTIRRREGLRGWFARRVFLFLRRQSFDLYSYRGQRMAVFANDYIGHKINVFGIYEKEELEALARFLEPVKENLQRSSCLDIGANIGNHALFFSKIFRHVHAFEPNPSTFRLLQLNASFHPNVSVHDWACGDLRGSFHLRECMDNFGKSHIVAQSSESSQGEVVVSVVPLDEIGFGDEEIALIKIDVEGLEARVLKGASQTISRHWPIIAMEQHESDFRNGSSEAISWLADRGYRFCWYEGRPTRNPVAKAFYDLREALWGVVDRIVADDKVPVKFHNMLIAVPPRYQHALGLAGKG